MATIMSLLQISKSRSGGKPSKMLHDSVSERSRCQPGLLRIFAFYWAVTQKDLQKGGII
jgi:hypothetical protein